MACRSGAPQNVLPIPPPQGTLVPRPDTWSPYPPAALKKNDTGQNLSSRVTQRTPPMPVIEASVMRVNLSQGVGMVREREVAMRHLSAMNAFVMTGVH